MDHSVFYCLLFKYFDKNKTKQKSPPPLKKKKKKKRKRNKKPKTRGPWATKLTQKTIDMLKSALKRVVYKICEQVLKYTY